MKLDLNRLFGTHGAGVSGYRNTISMTLTMASASQSLSATIFPSDYHGYNKASCTAPIFCDFIRDKICGHVECEQKYDFNMQIHLDRKRFEKLRDAIILALKVENDKLDKPIHFEFSRGKLNCSFSDVNALMTAFQKMKIKDWKNILKDEPRKTRGGRRTKVDVDSYIRQYSQ